ncbi:unnamed protein product [Ilex paraguariensis]|uniref:Uncharacterized protein n=1 Tax=Ilex paraguariensis TaxID=185542 RepID=A0ABC8SZN2_9AQUA
MVLLGFTKDPYPYIRKAALDGLAGLPKSVIVDDQSLIEGCYVRAVELLYDMEDCVRCSAVRTVIEWGQVLVASNEDQRKKDWSDLLFVQVATWWLEKIVHSADVVDLDNNKLPVGCLDPSIDRILNIFRI